jgi:DNA (cytosine-5)-methyltransferase 1
MKFGSVCSGIEAASSAWSPLGWKAQFFSEIEPFPCALLAHRYPDVPNHGDMKNYKDWPDATLDVLCGGTPCQSFSNAGLRAGLDDPRGQLMLTFGAIAARYRPKWLVWENVPGVLSSNGGRDFGAFLGLLGFLGYGFAYRVLDAQFVRVDGHGRAVPQRRNRVFVVGCLGDWRSAAAVLLEREGLRGDSAPRRVSGSRVAARTICSSQGGIDREDKLELIFAATLNANGKAAGSATQQDAESGLLLAFGGNNTSGPIQVATACRAKGGSGHGDFESETFVAHTLRGDGFDASEDGTGRGTPLVPVLPFDTTQITSASNYSNPKAGDPCHPLAAGAHAPAVAFGWQNAAAQGMPVDSLSPTLDKSKHPATMQGSAVRRLTPTECERLMGFPDGYTAVPFRGKPAADGPRYKALGNSWAVNCARWIGWRIAQVETINAERAA